MAPHTPTGEAQYFSVHLTILPPHRILKSILNFDRINVILRALAEPARRQIVERLRRSPVSVSELAGPFDMSLAAVMQHLQVLEDAGIVTSEKVGRIRSCHLEPSGMDVRAAWIELRRSPAERKLDRLAALLAEDLPSETEGNDRT